VLEDSTAILVNTPDRTLRVTPLHGSVEFGLLVGQSEAEDDVHFSDSKSGTPPGWVGNAVYRSAADQPGDVVGI